MSISRKDLDEQEDIINALLKSPKRIEGHRFTVGRHVLRMPFINKYGLSFVKEKGVGIEGLETILPLCSKDDMYGFMRSMIEGIKAAKNPRTSDCDLLLES